MIILHWLFNNNHLWTKNFDSVDSAINYVEFCGMYSDHGINRVWIDANDQQIWLKEKA